MGSATGAGTGTTVDAGAETGAEATPADVVAGAVSGLTGSCDEDASFEGEVGLGGNDGWRREFPKLVMGRGAAKAPAIVSSGFVDASDLLVALGTCGRCGVTDFAAACLILASAIFSIIFLRLLILASSSLIFFTKSLTSPGLQQNRLVNHLRMTLHTENSTRLDSRDLVDLCNPFPKFRLTLLCPSSTPILGAVVAFWFEYSESRQKVQLFDRPHFQPMAPCRKVCKVHSSISPNFALSREWHELYRQKLSRSV